MMKRYVALIALALSACQSVSTNPSHPSASTRPEDAKKVWRLSQFQSFSAEQLQNSEMDWTQLPRVSAYTGCNRIGFQANLDDKGSITTSPAFATRMYCADTMQLETEFLKAISSMKHYRVENQTLILNDGAGNEMRFVVKQ